MCQLQDKYDLGNYDRISLEFVDVLILMILCFY